MELTLFFLARNKNETAERVRFSFLSKYIQPWEGQKTKQGCISKLERRRFVPSELSPVDGSRERERVLKHCELSMSQDAILTWRSIRRGVRDLTWPSI